MDTSILWYGCRTVASWNSVFQTRPFWMVSLVKPPAWRSCSSLHFCAIYSASSFRLCWSSLCAACGACQTEVSGYPFFFTSVQGASSACLRLPSACAAVDDSVSGGAMPISVRALSVAAASASSAAFRWRTGLDHSSLEPSAVHDAVVLASHAWAFCCAW